MGIQKMKKFYLAAAIMGALIPLIFFSQFFSSAETGSMHDFIPALFVNGAASGFTADLLISSFVFWAWMFQRRDDGPKPWLFIALNLSIGLSCALPAYLYASSRRQ